MESRVKAAATAVKTVITLQSKADGSPVAGAMVVAFTDFANRIGAQGATNKQGVVRLSLGEAAKIERIYAYPATTFWGILRKNVSAANSPQSTSWTPSTSATPTASDISTATPRTAPAAE